jgi:DNA-binding CsgD family transcriptional regulator
VLSRCLTAARQGAGGVVFVEAPSGTGKSRLLTIAGDTARGAGMQVLGGQGTELERDFAFGVAIQLFEPRWLSLDAGERGRLLSGPARSAAELLMGLPPDGAPFPGDRGYALIHGLFCLVRNLTSAVAASSAVTMLVDDVHWADRRSLRFLAYLADRIAELPVALIVAARTGEPATDRAALTALRAAAAGDLLHPRSLSERGVAAIVRSQLPQAEPAFWRACARVTGGNPFLVVALVEHVRASGARPDGATAEQLDEQAPESVLNSVVARLRVMPAEVASVASAVAVLGEGASLKHTAELAGLDVGETARAADMLAGVHLFHPGAPVSFVHPLISSAVRASMSPLERGEAHRRAASTLRADGAPPEQIAAHLMVAPSSSDPQATAVLRAAARKTLAHGEAESAVRILERALAEQPPPQVDPELLAELGQAELAAGLPGAVHRMERAVRMTSERGRRTKLGLTHGRALHALGRYRDAAGVFAGALDEVDERSAELAGELDAAYLASASFVPELSEQVRVRGERLTTAVGDRPSPGQRAALAHLASLWSVQGLDRSTILAVAEIAWANGSLAEQATAGGLVWPLLAEALLLVDELERGLEICEVAAAAVRPGGAPSNDPAAAHLRAWALYEQGRVGEALAVGEPARDAPSGAGRARIRPVIGALAACYVQRGALAEAEEALSILRRPDALDSLHMAYLLDARARLRLAQRRPAGALADALEAGRRAVWDGRLIGPGALAWRSTAALAHLSLGDTLSAERLAREELELARSATVTRVIIRDLRVLGLAARGSRRLELLSEGVSVGGDYPPRLEHTQALIDLGGALRRANHRAAAREPLRRGLELSDRGGATVLADHARRELVASGARPRRSAFTGIDSLTPSERRVAEFAADGLTTRQIAGALFVTPKTVEFHLRHIYRKLSVKSREDLARTMETHDRARRSG